MGKEKFICDNCASIFERYPTQVRGKRRFCSHLCRHKWQKIGFVGEANPNFGNEWSIDQRLAGAEISRQRMSDPENRKKCAANKGRVFSEDSRAKMSVGQTNRIINSGPMRHTDESKLKIGISSRDKFTPEFKLNQKETMVRLGYWLSDAERSDYSIYFKQADWIQRMFDLASIEDLQKLSVLGVWNAMSNKKGLVRDHAYSRKSGFTAGVFPKLLHHPANLQLISHGDNVKKAQSLSIPDDSISLENLFLAIEAWNSYWIEQTDCLLLIKEYKNGNRWQR